MARFRRKAYVDLDPGFTQIWHETGHLRVGGHDAYFTVGTNIGSAACTIPTGGTRWQPILPPIVLDEWPVCSLERRTAFTTIANWRGPFGPVQWNGKTLGLKVHEFRKFLDLPAKTGQQFELALNIHRAEEKDLQALDRHGWKIVNPSEVAGDPDSYRRYVQNSGAEFSAAQEIYVATQSGWFSDRTAAYLASGKPALVQDTGFSRMPPIGKGLVSFRTPEEASDGARIIRDDYPGHCRAARTIAEEFFDSRKVLGSFLTSVGIH